MFHVKHRCIQSLTEYGLTLPPGSTERLTRYAEWLASEGVTAGGIGPNEVDRLWDRHICDALAYACVTSQPIQAVDVGSGVGLPGVPLATIWPATQWTLLDRSGRRVALARRAVRVLGLENVETQQGDVETETRTWPLVVSRATFPPKDALRRLLPLIGPSGLAVLGARRGIDAPKCPVAPPHVTVEAKSVEVLDPPCWFFMIRHCE